MCFAPVLGLQTAEKTKSVHCRSVPRSVFGARYFIVLWLTRCINKTLCLGSPTYRLTTAPEGQLALDIEACGHQTTSPGKSAWNGLAWPVERTWNKDPETGSALICWTIGLPVCLRAFQVGQGELKLPAVAFPVLSNHFSVFLLGFLFLLFVSVCGVILSTALSGCMRSFISR